MSENWIENLEAYAEGSISRQELEEVARKEGITDVQQEILWYEDVRLAIGAEGLRNQLREDLLKESSLTGKRKFGVILAIAASLLVVFGGVWVWLGADQQELYAEYEYIDPGLPVVMSQSDEYQLYDALTYYSEANYEVAARKLQKLVSDGKSTDTVLYYLGASELYGDHPSKAREILMKIETNSAYGQRVEWLLVLTALKEDDRSLAESYLEPILNEPAHPFFDQAKSLKGKLEAE